MEELNDIIKGGTAAIELPYFLLPIHEGDPVYRERVYCYELYHQMRRRWPDACVYSLNGEVDKRSHATMVPLVGAVKPDFLVHTPGNMDGNHAVIEVKSQAADGPGIRKDIATLSNFVAHGGYGRAIYLIYGWNADRTAERIYAELSEMPQPPPIECWVHLAPGNEAIRKF